LICATRGEVGEIDPQFKDRIKSAACLRTQELRCAAKVLGVGHLHFLNYRDSGMSGSEANAHPRALAAQPIEAVAQEVAHLIRQIQPDVVLTFDPIGGYRHQDHIAIHQASVLAFELAGEPSFEDPEELVPFKPEKLYYNTISHTFLKVMVWVLRLLGKNPRKFGRNQDIDLVALTDVSFPTHVRIDYRPVKALRDKAAACHASQGGVEMSKGFRGFITRLFGGTHETFMQAFPEPDAGEGLKRDLFG